MKKICLELVLIFIITLLYNIFCSPINMDDVWCYGFSYNIATGLIPYSDFNMVVGPIFPMLGSLFLIILGKNMLVFNIFGSLMATLLFFLMKKINNKSCYIIYAIFLFFSAPNYSVLCLIFLYLLLLLENNDNNNDYLIGIILGLVILTKIHIGLFLCIPTLFIKDIKRIFRRIFSCELFVLLCFLIMLVCGNLEGFFNYTVLGLFDFTNNTKFYIWGVLTIVAIIILLYFYLIKKEKNINIIYLLCFQIMSYPLFDTYHVLLGFIPVMGYVLNKLNLNQKVSRVAFFLFILIIGIYNIYSININNKVLDSESVLFKYKITEEETVSGIKEIVNYIKNIDNNKNIYIIDSMAYVYKLESGIPINKFDLISYGNMGYKGLCVYINDIENNCHGNCVFLVDSRELTGVLKTQTNKELVKYIVDTYDIIDNINYIDVYGG